MGVARGDSAAGRELFCEIVGHHGFEIEELEVDKDHVHLFLSFLPKYSISAVVGRLKAVSAKEIGRSFRRFGSSCGAGVLGRWECCSDGG